MNIDTKELAVVKTQVTKAKSAAEVIVIKTDEQMLEAAEVRKKIKVVGKMIKEKKEAITKPINEALRNIRELFKPLEEGYEQAEGMIADKMLTYQRVVDEVRRKAEIEAQRKLEEAQKALDEGKITEKQVEKIEAKVEAKLEKAPEVITKSEDFHTRTIKKFKIVDENLIPREYLDISETKIRKAMMAGVVVAGVEYYEEKTLV